MRIHYDLLCFGIRPPKWYGFTIQDEASMYTYWHLIPLNYLIRFYIELIRLQLEILRRIL